jgi:glycosyltransferase involved in cell wall biosynthesis
MRQLLAELQIDLIQTHNVKSHFLIRLSGASRNVPWVAWNHGYTWPTWRQRVYNSFDYISLRGADRVITVTGSFVSGLEGMGVRRDRIEVVGNAIEVENSDLETGKLRREDYARAGERIVLAVGRLSKEKAHQRLIEATARLNKDSNGPAHVVVLVGDGPERQNLEAYAKAEGVRLILAGQVSKVRPFYDLADVFVLPSDSEGSPNVLLEAMAEGLPIVSTNVGGVKETVNDSVEAILVEAGNSKALSEALSKIARQPEEAREMGERARHRVIQERSSERRAQHILRIYEDLLKERPSK